MNQARIKTLIRRIKKDKKYSDAFIEDYDRIYFEQNSPEEANILLLLFKAANNKGMVMANEDEIAHVLNMFMADPKAYYITDNRRLPKY